MTIEMNEEFIAVIEKSEWIAIATSCVAGIDMVAAWGYRLRKIGIQNGGYIVLPAGKYHRTEENLEKDSRIQLLIASSEINRSDGEKGQGYRISGRGKIQKAGAMADLTKVEFPWARGALVVSIEKIEALIS